MVNYQILNVSDPYKHDYVYNNKKISEYTIQIDFKFDGKNEARFYAYKETKTIYEEINKEKVINLSYCYVDNFSLREYRKIFGFSRNAYVMIKDIYANDAFFNNNFDLSYIHVTGDKVLFDRTQFGNGAKNFYKTRFTKCLVSMNDVCFRDGNIIFSESEFGNINIDFSSSFFGKGLIDFTLVQFGHGFIDFSSTIFKNSIINFTNTNFGNGRLSFYNAVFLKCNLFFPSSIFGNGLINFSKSEFRMGKILFCESRFGYGDLDFTKSKFLDCKLNFDKIRYNSKNIVFYNSTVNDLSFNDCQFNNYLDLRVSECKKLDLTNSIVRDIIDFRPDQVSKACINKLTIIGIQNVGRINIDWEKNNVKQLIDNQGEKTTHQEKADQFRILKENFHKIGQYDDEDKAYVEFKFHELRNELDENRKKYKGIKKFVNILITNFKILLFEKIGLYGTSPIKIMKTMGWTLLLFSIIYLLPCLKFNQTKNFTDQSFLNKILTSIYHSIVTFLTIGYGDINPANFGTVIVSGIEGFIGLFLMAYFVVAFSRKVLR